MVQPVIEYAAIIWSPYTYCDIYKVEMVQHRAARFIMNNYTWMASVTDTLKKLDLPSFEKWGKMMKMIMMYRIVNDLVKLDHSNLP